MITVNKELLLHPDFATDIADELCKMLEAIIDSEFEKGDETDFDFIDECADAINAIRSGDSAQIIPLISRKDFLKKVGINTDSRIKAAVAVCAAIALVFTAGAQIKNKENISLIQSFSGVVSDFFAGDKQIETTSVQPSTTEKTANLINIAVETADDFKTEYYIGEKFSDRGIIVFAEYENGERMLTDNYTLEIPEDFGTAARYEKILLSSNGFTFELTVRVIEGVETKKLNSIYAVFPDDFDFTTDDLYNFDYGSMQVYAVYSDGSERELSEDEYIVTQEHGGAFIDRYIEVTVTYQDCTCSFTAYKE